jgi:hypothetical protein
MKHNSLKICCAGYPIKLRKVGMTAIKFIIIQSEWDKDPLTEARSIVILPAAISVTVMKTT